jgi:serine/threonine protein kinase
MIENNIKVMANIDDLFESIDEPTKQQASITPELSNIQNIDDRYIKPSPVAKGGMKCISKVFDLKVNRYVAMATLHDNAPQKYYDPFIREARLTALLDHPHIMSIHDIGTADDGTPYFTMDLKSGSNLARLIEQNKEVNNLAQQLEIFLKVCDAISYSHSNNVIHLDLKPDNIQVGEFGEVLVCDWGLAKILNTPDKTIDHETLLNPDLLNNITLAGQIRGTPGFMSPEQVKSEDKNIQSDIYALGCILYNILTGEAPFSGSLEQILKNTTSSGICPPRVKYPNKHISESLNAIVEKAVKIDPKMRYQSVSDLKNDIKKYLDGYSPLAENASYLKELQLFYGRNKTFCLTLLSSISVLIIMTVLFVSNLNTSKRKAEQAWKSSEKYRQKAIIEKENAVKSLMLYRNEKTWSEAFIKENYQLIKKEVYKYTDRLIYGDIDTGFTMGLNYLNRMVTNQPSFKWAYNQRAYVHFLMQEFSKAKQDYAVNNNGDLVFRKLSDEFAPKIGVGKVLNTQDLKQVITQLSKTPKYYAQTIIMLRYDAIKRTSMKQHSEIVKTILEIHNPLWKDGDFDYNIEQNTLILRGKSLKKLTVNAHSFQLQDKPKSLKFVSLIKSLNPRKVDLRHTSIKSLAELAELDVIHLDIRHTPIKDLNYLSRLPFLKKITITKGQLTQQEIQKLSNIIDFQIL